MCLDIKIKKKECLIKGNTTSKETFMPIFCIKKWLFMAFWNFSPRRKACDLGKRNHSI